MVLNRDNIDTSDKTIASERNSEADGLIDFISEVAGEDHLKVEENLGDGFVRLRTAEAERRQAKHDIRCVEDIVIEMLRNSRDAGASHIYLATTRNEVCRFLTFVDDGEGIPAHMHHLIFEPRVTSKLETMVVDNWGVHGRGMALYSIHENSLSAKVVSSDEGLGSSLSVEVDLSKVSEKADQSTYPQLVKDEDGVSHIARGPHNIIRQVLEFSMESPGVEVYLGTPTEIANSLCQSGREHLTDKDLYFCDDLNTLPVCLRLSACGDATELAEMSESIGLPISERTAHRILAGDMPTLRPAISKLVPVEEPKHLEIDALKDRRGLKISKDDIEDFSLTLENAFEALATKYYLQLSDMPHVTVTKDCIRVRFDIEKDR